MPEPTTRGPAVEIEELEKRLRANSPPPQKPKNIRIDIPEPQGMMREKRPDPLAELARRMPPTQNRNNHKTDSIAQKPQQSIPRQNLPRALEPARPEFPAAQPFPVSKRPEPASPASGATSETIPALRVPAAPPSRAVSPPPLPPQSPLGRSSQPTPALPPLPPVPSAPQQHQTPSLPALPPLPRLPPLPPLPELQHSLPLLPPLPKLPRPDLQAGSKDLPPTFKPPAPPPPAYEDTDMFLRGTLAGEERNSGERHDQSGDAPGMTTGSGSWLTTPEPTVAAQWREDQKAPAKTPAPPYPPPPASAASRAPDIRAIDPAYARQRGADHGGYQNHDNAIGGWPDDDEQQAFEEFDFDEESFSPTNGNQRRDPAAMDLNDVGRKLRPWHAIVAVAALAFVSIGWSFLHRSGVGGSREIATIQAPEGPMKVKPTIEPEPDAPTAGAATVLDRNEAEPVKKVVKNLEQAVDPSVAPQQNDAANPETTPPAETPKVVQLGAGPVDAPHEPPPARAVQQPRKVKSVAVPAIPVTQPLEQATAAPPQPTAPAAPKPATAGTYSAQFASANSEAEARTLLKNLSGKYGGATGGGKFTFRPVKSGDKTVYRIRVGGLTREGAEALCAKAKAGGDACAATGN